KSRSLERRCGRLPLRVNAANCWRSARFSRATARCPRQISPMARRQTMSTVSMRDLVANGRGDQSTGQADRVVAKDAEHTIGGRRAPADEVPSQASGGTLTPTTFLK